jgi:predicted small metal-binding protein
MYEIRCKSLGFDCPGVVRDLTKDAVLQQALAHAAQLHGVTATPALAASVMAKIQLLDGPGAHGTSMPEKL